MAAPQLAVTRFWPTLLFCLAVAGLLAVQVLTQGPMTQVDQWVTLLLASHRQAWLTQVLLWISDAHETVKLLAVTALIALWRGWRRDTGALWLLPLVPAAMLLNVGLKHLMVRPRPLLDEPLVHLTTYSFPSGHAVASTVFYGVMCALVFIHARSRPVRFAAMAVAVTMVLLVTFSRVYLGAHYLSDVIAGVAVGITCLLAAQRWRRRVGSR